MTTEEKLKHFQDICMEDARDRSAKMLDDYMAALEKSFEEHTADAKRRADMQVAMETEKLEREMNKRLSIAQLDLKREVSHKQEELKDVYKRQAAASGRRPACRSAALWRRILFRIPSSRCLRPYRSEMCIRDRAHVHGGAHSGEE